MQAVENAISKLSDEKFAATSGITIFYFTQKGDKNIYRSKVAKCYFVDNQEVEYEEDDIYLGTREMLEIAFKDFKAKAEKDENVCADWFDVEDLYQQENSKISLDFKLPENL